MRGDEGEKDIPIVAKIVLSWKKSKHLTAKNAQQPKSCEENKQARRVGTIG